MTFGKFWLTHRVNIGQTAGDTHVSCSSWSRMNQLVTYRSLSSCYSGLCEAPMSRPGGGADPVCVTGVSALFQRIKSSARTT